MAAASLTTIVKRALAHEASLPRGTSTIVVAVSGGPDSMALLAALARVGPTMALTIRAHGVDHGLREEASRELDLAETFAKSVSVPFDRTRVKVAKGGNLQARARVARWNALAAVARLHKAAIATAHHADDRAETLLMRLLRGSGVRGLAVLPSKATAPDANDVVVIRPLLRARRADVLLHIARHAIPHATDPSNDDPRYLRTRVRKDVLPLLEELDPEIVRHIEAIADELVAESPKKSANGDRASLTATTTSRTPSWAVTLPRATQVAIANLLRDRSADARVWLPNGLVLSVKPAQKARNARAGSRSG